MAREPAGAQRPRYPWCVRSLVLVCVAACGTPSAPPAQPKPPPDAAVDTAIVEAIDENTPPRWIGLFLEDDSNVVRDVLETSPADKGGVRVGDRVISVGGAPIATVADIIALVQSRSAGVKVDVVIERGGKRMTLPVTIEYRPDVAALQQSKLHGKPAPRTELKTLDGASWSLANMAGKVVLVDFWATWCKPCVGMMPTLNEWHAKYGPKGLVIAGITDDEPDVATATVAENKLAYTILQDADHRAWKDFLVSGLPTTVVVDKKGVIRHVSIGASPDESAALEMIFLELLK
jgi:thiol-disulfide isomerase/thioredoxin